MLKNYQNLTSWKIDSFVDNKNVFAYTTKRFGDSTMYSYWDMDQKNTNFKSVFFGQNFKIYGQIRILIFCCTTLIKMLIVKKVSNVYM